MRNMKFHGSKTEKMEHLQKSDITFEKDFSILIVVLQKRVEVLEQTIEKAGASLTELEEREGAASEREATQEEKLKYLEQQSKEVQPYYT